MEIAHDLREWFNEQGLRKMVVDIREYETYGAYLNGELVGFQYFGLNTILQK
jgi:hypothetical protein